MTRGRLRAFAASSVLGLVVAFAGCGGDDGESGAGREPITTTVQVAEAATAGSAPSVPAELVGTYEAERKGGEFPPGRWRLAIGPRGEFFIVPPGETGFFNSPLTVSDGSLVVPPHPDSGCTEPGQYTYAVKGDGPGGSLTLKATDEPCETRSSLLSASWKMTD